MSEIDWERPWVVEQGDEEIAKSVLVDLATMNFPGTTLHILEWGAGGSTVYYPRYLDSLNVPYVWFAIEHNPNVKHNSLSPRISPYTFIIENPIPRITGPTSYQAAEWDEHSEGLKLYYCQIGNHLRPPEGFHFIYVDGFYRYSCLEISQTLLHKKGVLLMDNADRADPERLKKLKFKGEFLKPHIWRATL